MVRKSILALLMLMFTGCMMLSGNPVAMPTPIPTFTPAFQTTPIPNTIQAAPLGGKQSDDLFVWIYSKTTPPIRGENVFEVFVTDAKGQPVTDAKISYDIDMTNMSHGKNIIEATALGEGHYSGNVHFLMPGPWRVIISVRRPEKTSTVRFDFNVNSN
jgi:hypothetical protein